jgi:hypothetical protein
VRPVKADVSAYLAKYLSKGSEVLSEFIEAEGVESVPSTWWNLSGKMRDLLKRNVRKGVTPGRVLENVLNYMFDVGDFSPVHWVRHVEIEMGTASERGSPALVTVGYRGHFTSEVLAGLKKDVDMASK